MGEIDCCWIGGNAFDDGESVEDDDKDEEEDGDDGEDGVEDNESIVSTFPAAPVGKGWREEESNSKIEGMGVLEEIILFLSTAWLAEYSTGDGTIS